MFKSDILRTLDERGFIKDVTDRDALDGIAISGSLVAYVGFDLTAPSLHVGSMIQIMMIRHLLRDGCGVHVLFGGATTRVGDPTGKDAARPRLGDQEIARNMEGIMRVITATTKIEDRNGWEREVVRENNLDWLQHLDFMEFLEEYAPLFSVNRMLAMDSVRARLDRQSPMSMLEFCYSMMQAIDYLSLHQSARCNLQFGGSDQWSNILSGVDLVRRKTGHIVHGLTTPLMLNTAGEKMGKTADGAIWLDDKMTSVNQFWQFWRNVEDEKVGEFLGLFTELPMDEVTRLRGLGGSDINDAKIILATEATRIIHGSRAAEKARMAAHAAFVEGDGTLETATVPATIWDTGSVVDVFKAAGIVPSKNEAVRLLRQSHIRLHDADLRGNLEFVRSPGSFLTICRGEVEVQAKIGRKRRFTLVRDQSVEDQNPS